MRLTIRTDYKANTWDLYINGQMAMANVPSTYSGLSGLSNFTMVASPEGPAKIDDFSAVYVNPLFADVNNDGIDDSWETANGLSLTTSDRTVALDGTTAVQAYLNSNASQFNIAPPAPVVITSLINANGQPGPQGLVSVIVTEPDGEPDANASVAFSVTTGASTISGSPGTKGSSQVTVSTDSTGLAQAYVNFISNASDVLVVTAQSTPVQTSALTIVPQAAAAPATISVPLITGQIPRYETYGRAFR